MKLRLEFDCDNAAFGSDAIDRADETSRILRKVMGKGGAGDVEGIAMDTNGNTVGGWAFTGGEEAEG